MKLRTAFRGVLVHTPAPLFPTVGLHSRGECIQVNFGQAPFKFDLEGMLAEEHAATRAAIDAMPLPPDAIHSVVAGYLTHFG